MLMDVACLNVVADVSVRNRVETLTSSIVDWFLVYAHIKAVERVMRHIFINDLIHKLFSSSIWVLVSMMAPAAGQILISFLYMCLHCRACGLLEFSGNLISNIKPSRQILVS